MKTIAQILGQTIYRRLAHRIDQVGIGFITPASRESKKISKNRNLRHHINVHDWSFFWDLVMGYDLGFAKSYLEGKWDYNDLPSLFTYLANKSTGSQPAFLANLAPQKIVARAVQALRSSNSLSWSRRNISAHYDLSNDFFSNFLDASMTYSCAVFDKTENTLEEAQYNKIRSLIQGAKTSANDSILDIGCGWGGLSRTAAAEFGANVTAVTLSLAQFKYAVNLFRNQGLEDRIKLLNTDYRLLQGQYNHIFSVEMLEAVGHRGTSEFFRKCSSLLKPGGTLQIQVITIPNERYHLYRRNCDFIQKFIFPGGLLLSPDLVRNEAIKAGFLVQKERKIGRHYITTLQHWRKNLVENKDKITQLGFEERDYRRFIYYFSYCEGAFNSGRVDDYQFFLRKV